MSKVSALFVKHLEVGQVGADLLVSELQNKDHWRHYLDNRLFQEHARTIYEWLLEMVQGSSDTEKLLRYVTVSISLLSLLTIDEVKVSREPTHLRRKQ
jgi:hypothetical protein